jgi:LmbE family N-acetylglucosaminyl deacetylase
MVAALEQRRAIEEQVAVVVAHPDDETIAAGGSLHLMRRVLLVHVTDGAPLQLGDAAREGFDTPSAYAAARERELRDALGRSGAQPERVTLGVPDQEASAAIPQIADRLGALFRAHGVRHALTHAYEGGHPDHDAVALAVHLACGEVFEFAGYHAAPEGGIRTGVFVEPSRSGRGLGEAASACKALTPPLSRGERGKDAEIVVTLSPQELARKRAMIACFRTQAKILSQFDPARERFRAAPAYDFTAPAHEGRLLYEEWGWMSGAEWRRSARAALEGRCAA